MLTDLIFLSDLPLYDYEKPYILLGFPDIPEEKRTKSHFTAHKQIYVESIRGREEEFSIAKHGFTYLKHASECSLRPELFERETKDDSVVMAYLKECIELVRKQLGGAQAMCIDWRLRRNAPDVDEDNEEGSREVATAPASVIHCDFSQEGGQQRLLMHLSDEERAKIAKQMQRVQFFNVWRPLHTVNNAPLVLCDRRSVRARDVLEADKVFPTKIDLDHFVKYRLDQKWYWLPEQQPDEVIMF